MLGNRKCRWDWRQVAQRWGGEGKRDRREIQGDRRQNSILGADWGQQSLGMVGFGGASHRVYSDHKLKCKGARWRLGSRRPAQAQRKPRLQPGAGSGALPALRAWGPAAHWNSSKPLLQLTTRSRLLPIRAPRATIACVRGGRVGGVALGDSRHKWRRGLAPRLAGPGSARCHAGAALVKDTRPRLHQSAPGGTLTMKQLTPLMAYSLKPVGW